MNLLTDPWIPVLYQGRFQHLTLKDMLCKNADWQLCSFRDDMELAALQLVICLVQIIFIPENTKELYQRLAISMDEAEYSAKIKPYHDIFILDHPKHPFMQSPGVKAKEPTPIQKLFIGLPEGNNHSLFNNPGEISHVCPACVAVALFNQANNCPSFGGGFKGSLRGGAPITTLVRGKNLCSTVWRNVLCRDAIEQFISEDGKVDQPVWMVQIKSGEIIHPHQIGLLRGLFWQPSRLMIEWVDSEGFCAACNMLAKKFAIGFKKEKFNYEIKGHWLHPHSPREWNLKKGNREERFASFTTTAPAWTQLNTFLINKESEKEGYIPSAVVSQFREAFINTGINLIAGGYRVKQASVLQRRHEMINLPAGWAENMDKVERLILMALDIKGLLRNKLYGFAKKIGVSGLPAQAEERFYQNSEGLIHRILRTMNYKEAIKTRQDLIEKLSALARQIFDEVTQPYQHTPKMIKTLALSRKSFQTALSKLSTN